MNTSVIEYFGFNTTNGGMFVMHNKSVEDIKAELKKRFPNWSDACIEKVISNKEYYKMPIPVKTENHTKRSGIKRNTLNINGYPLNDVLKLGMSIHTYKAYSYRYWGNIVKEKIFSNNEVSENYDIFEKSYANVVKAVKTPNTSKGIINASVIEMYTNMVNLKNAIIKTGVIESNKNDDFVSSDGRKLGIKVLMERVAEMEG